MMGAILLRRCAALPPLLLAVSLLVFGALRLMPGDPARLMAGPQATLETVAAMRGRLGLDRPLGAQYVAFLVRAAHLDLGVSLESGAPVVREIGERLPNTLRLAGLSYGLALLLGLPLGMLAAVRRGGWTDRGLVALSALGASVANFWLALVMMELFAVRLRWLPLLGAGSWPHYVLPVAVLSIGPGVLVLRMSRAGMIEVLSQDYIRTARAKGLSEPAIWFGHALRNALTPIVTVMALNLGSVIGGAVVTETVFDWPGAGRLLIDAVRYRDYPVIQGMVLLAVLAVSVANLLADLLITLLNPRIRIG